MPWSAFVERTVSKAIIAEAFAASNFNPLYGEAAA